MALSNKQELQGFVNELSRTFGPDGARTIFTKFCHALGGQRIRVPTIEQVMTESLNDARNARIRKAFNGRNHAELAQQFGVSVRTVRRVVDGRA